MQITLSHKAYLTSDKPDSNCQYVAWGTDAYQTLYFLNETEFLKIYSGCCGGPGEDFADEAYYKGKYELTEKELILRYEADCVVHYIKQDSVMSTDSTYHVQERTELERVQPGEVKYERFDCGAVPYFKEKDGEFQNTFISQVGDTFFKKIDALKADGTWEKLFPKNAGL